ncbi:Panacea domain-containing protein [Loktanella agnita]|uniref:Panacea domain-containing protein n=1 Tax=Loktanella agnita TaxID=287097 RepID=UPI003989261B
MYGYKERKAAQVAAYFAIKEQGSINVLKLAKLLYLAERESMNRFDEPMFFDRLVSMDHGPVTSIALNQVNGLTQSTDWDAYIAGRTGYEIKAAEGLTLESLNELSKADLRILEDLWDSFGEMSQYQLRDWTHTNCREWENPHGSSKPIPHDRVFKFLGKEHAELLSEAVHAYREKAQMLEASC